MVSKNKTRQSFVCNDCGQVYAKWQGQCTSCKAWNTLSEVVSADVFLNDLSIPVEQNKKIGFAGDVSSICMLNTVDIKKKPRFSSGFYELDRVLGGGIVPGSAILIGGHPGAGKSTLLLQVLCHLSHIKSVLYVSGEESLQQIAARANRLHLSSSKVKLIAETSVERILTSALQEKVEVIVIDSIQVMSLNSIESAPGGMAQVRESAAYLTRYAKQRNTAMLIVGHVTKDYTLAGPMTLSHIVDTQIMLENSEDSRYRMVRATKNRFGQVNELGVFAMTDSGMKEVKHPSAIFLNRGKAETSGSVITALWEGTRALLVEIQALVVDSQLGNPRRVAVGMDTNRLSMLLAILFRHGGILTANQDVFTNVVGGIRITETSADLACIIAVVSGLRNQPFDQHTLVLGEVGLSGEIRPVPCAMERIQEAAKHGFKKAIVSQANISKKSHVHNMDIKGVHTLQEVLNII